MAVIGISDLTMWKVLSDDENGLVCDVPRKFTKKLIKASFAPENASDGLDADNQRVEQVDLTTGGKFTLNITDLTSEERAYMLGAEIEGGIATDNAEDERPYFIVAYRVKKTRSAYRYVKYYKVMFSMPNDDAETAKKGSVTFQTPSIEGNIIPVTAQLDGLNSGDYRKTIDTDSAGWTEQIGKNWFIDVVPKSSPVEFAVGSTTPADNASGVAADASLSVVFTDNINADSAKSGIILLGSSGIIPCTVKVIGKKAEIVPDNEFSAETEYSAVISQNIRNSNMHPLGKDTVIRFTTA